MPRAAPKPSPRTPATVTRAFLFSDLRGYTEFVETHGDGAASDLLRAYRSLVRTEVEKQSGAEVKTEGDSFYVVFESPKAALDCAVRIQRAAAEHAGRDTKAPLSIGIGLHAGETVPYDDQFVGGAVNVAARLASKAKAGEVVASDTLRGLVRTAVRYEMADRGPLKLKGVAERIRAYAVEWREDAPSVAGTAVPPIEMPLLSSTLIPTAGNAPGQIVCPVVVGRDAERARFAEHLELAAGGRGQTVIVAGEAGVGKSAFVREALAAAGLRGFRILYGATVESDRGLPYAPFVAAVRSGFRGIARDRLGRVLGQAAPDLAQLFPELGKAQRSEAASTAEHHRLSVAFLGLFTTFAREAPVLLVVEDLHWADEASLGLFHYLTRELRDARATLLGTYRSDEMHRRHPLLRVIAAMQRERIASEIALDRLDKEQVRSLILATFGRSDANIRVSDEFRDAIYARSEGNPFFTEELLKSLVESGDVFYRPETGWERKPIDQLRIPGSIREAVRERIDRLSADAQATVSAAAVIGLRAPFELLRAVRGITEAEAEAHLRELIEQQLVVELGGDDDEYGFRHALTKEVVYDDLLVRERKRLHREVADVLGGGPEAEPALVAHHLIAAGEPAAAVPRLLEAADRALQAYAPREAAAHYEKALEIGFPDGDLASVTERLAEAYHLYDWPLSRKAAEEAAGLYRERDDRRGESRMLRLASRTIWQLGEPDRALEVAKAALAVLDGIDETVEHGRAIAHLATHEMLAHHDAEAIAWADRAIGVGERCADDWTLANALITKGTSVGRTSRDEGRPIIRRGLDLAMVKGLAEVALRGFNNLVIISDAPESDRLIDEAAAYGARHGVQHPMIQHLRAWTEMFRGNWDGALAAAAEIPAGTTWARSAAALVGIIACGRKGPDRALETYEPVARAAADMKEAQAFAGPVLLAAMCCLLKGDDEEARLWMERYRERAVTDEGVARIPSYGPGWVAASLGARFGHADVIEAIARERPREGVEAAIHDATLGLARALAMRDPPASAAALTALYDAWSQDEVGALPEPLLVMARIHVSRGSAPEASWLGPLGRARAFAERAGATWALAELGRIEAAIAERR
ncbi:MAG: AAA family ATPase [Chloroflexi bacterium]|nr:AAA family ATPase [Chloroflexota bacterium]